MRYLLRSGRWEVTRSRSERVTAPVLVIVIISETECFVHKGLLTKSPLFPIYTGIQALYWPNTIYKGIKALFWVTHSILGLVKFCDPLLIFTDSKFKLLAKLKTPIQNRHFGWHHVKCKTRAESLLEFILRLYQLVPGIQAVNLILITI